MSRHKHTFYIENLQQFTSSHERGALKVIQQHKNKNTSPTCKKLTVKFPRPRGAVLINKIQIGLSFASMSNHSIDREEKDIYLGNAVGVKPYCFILCPLRAPTILLYVSADLAIDY